MAINELKEQIPDWAKDAKLNLSSLFNLNPNLGISTQQNLMLIYSCSLSTKNTSLISEIEQEIAEQLSDAEKKACKTVSSLMAMNNVFYRFLHLAEDKQISTIPAGLRMNAMLKPGVDKDSFELMSLAISALNGCGMCIKSHIATLQKNGISSQAIHHAAKVASIINSVSLSISI